MCVKRAFQEELQQFTKPLGSVRDSRRSAWLELGINREALMVGQGRQSQTVDDARGLDITQHITGGHQTDSDVIKQTFIKHHSDCHLRKGLSGEGKGNQGERTPREGFH